MLAACSKCRYFRQLTVQSRHVPRFSFSAQTASNDWIYHSETGIVSRRDEPLFQSVIGIEIHAQLAIPTKLFSSAPTTHDTTKATMTSSPNSAVWPLDVAVPGALPRLSQDAVHAAILTAAALQCDIAHESRFERKHYAYADLPLGYQITQQRWPLATNGTLTCRRTLAMPNQKEQSKKNKGKRRRGQRGEKNEAEVKPETKAQEQVTAVQDKFFTVGINRIQIEQDTGKTTTVTRRETDSDGTEYMVTESLVDFNRAGCALVEIVFCPDIRSATEAASVVSTLRNLLRHVCTCDGKMEEGSLRCDLNVSIAPLKEGYSHAVDEDNPFQASLPPGTGNRVEVKNLNSVRQVTEAAEYEALRQAEAYANGTPTERETRTFDVRTGETVTIRSKEGAVDYRFMPEPDLPPLVLNKETLDEFLEDNLPELPEEATARLMEEYGISESVALTITGDAPAIPMFEEAVVVARGQVKLADKSSQIPGMIANWLCNDLFALVKESAEQRSKGTSDAGGSTDSEVAAELNHPVSVQYSAVDANQLGLLIAMILDGTISTTMAKKILSVLFKEEVGSSPIEIADARGWKIISDPEELVRLCELVVLDPKHEPQLQLYQKGGKHVFKMEKFFIGKVMKESKGNAHPKLLKDALQAVLQAGAPDVDKPK